MDVLIILILASLGVAAAFLGGFIWAVKSGQYEDISTPALRVLTEEPTPDKPPSQPFDSSTPSEQ